MSFGVWGDMVVVAGLMYVAVFLGEVVVPVVIENHRWSSARVA